MPALSVKEGCKGGQLWWANPNRFHFCLTFVLTTTGLRSGTTTPRKPFGLPRPPHPLRSAPPRRGSAWYIRAEWPGRLQSAQLARVRGVALVA